MFYVGFVVVNGDFNEKEEREIEWCTGLFRIMNNQWKHEQNTRWTSLEPISDNKLLPTIFNTLIIDNLNCFKIKYTLHIKRFKLISSRPIESLKFPFFFNIVYLLH